MSKKKSEEVAQETNSQASTVEPVAGEQLQELIEEVAESKAAKFKRLAEKRVTKALIALRAIKPLSNKFAYDYTTEQVDSICSAIVTAATDIRKAFDGQKETKTGFTL
jgi:hypothetical protein